MCLNFDKSRKDCTFYNADGFKDNNESKIFQGESKSEKL